VTSETLSSTLDLCQVGKFANTALADCETIATFSDVPGQTTRLFLTAATKRLHTWLRQRMERAGLQVRVDALGNVIGHYPAAESTQPERVLLVGSHLDTVVNAGRYDGPLGVMLGVALIESLAGQKLPYAIDIVAFSEEEGVRFHTPYLGSAAIAGQFERRWFDLVDKNGITLANAIASFGLNVSALPAAAYDPARVIGYLEVHIEQGPLLERNGWPVAVVSALAGQSRLRFRFVGEAGHAGTLPMECRSDALAAAAEFVVAAEAVGRRTEGLRVTVGCIDVSPNVRNIIPGDVLCSVDVRHPEDTARRSAVDQLLQAAHLAGKTRSVQFHCEAADEQPAVGCDAQLRSRLMQALRAAGYPPSEVYCGAGHDLVMMAKLCPSAMLLVRHPGLSHHPSETVAAEDVTVALAVLRRAVLALAE
jgi:allantoate deiminase